MTRPEPDLTGAPIKPVDQPPTDAAGQSSHGPALGPRVRGYRELTDGEVDLINSLKEMQENVAIAWAHVYALPGTDRRRANIAKTHLEQAFSSLVGAVAKPHDPFAAALLQLDAGRDLGQPRSSQDGSGS